MRFHTHIHLHDAWDPSQSRDPDGKFGSSGGAGARKRRSIASKKQLAENRAAKGFGTPRNRYVPGTRTNSGGRKNPENINKLISEQHIKRSLEWIDRFKAEYNAKRRARLKATIGGRIRLAFGLDAQAMKKIPAS